MLEAPEPCPPNADLWRAHSNPSAEAPALLDDVEIDLMSSDSSPTLPAIPPAATGFPAQAQPSWPPPLGSSASAGLRRACRWLYWRCRSDIRGGRDNLGSSDRSIAWRSSEEAPKQIIAPQTQLRFRCKTACYLLLILQQTLQHQVSRRGRYGSVGCCCCCWRCQTHALGRGKPDHRSPTRSRSMTFPSPSRKLN